ncbi:hypothetical protein R1sor_004777 [Riccia sorocarpa]|uniref:Uncharacterized protein n=1 Tax=Riccia sorocarpa TaxID=122646 RepID=A0ABD3HJL1_9MARC
MGCGVSKEDFAEPSRIQHVVVRDGSPAKAHEVAAPSTVTTTLLTPGSTDTIIATPCASPVSLVIADVQPVTPAQETLVPAPAPEIPDAEVLVHAQETTPAPHEQETTPAPEAAPGVLLPETPALVSPPESPEHILENGTDGTSVFPYPCESSNGGDPYPCSKSPELELELEPKSSSAASGRICNGLVGTLASLEEILNGQETVSINSKLRVTADKIVSYGGVLRSLEDTVELQAAVEEEQQEAENESETPKTTEVKPEPEPEVESEPEVAPAADFEAESLQTFIGPFENHREEPEHQAATPPMAPKKLPPLEAPTSFLLDKGTDPFVKALFPTQLTKSVSTTTTHNIPVSPINLTSSHGPPSPPSPSHSTKIEMLSLDHVKDIKVVDGTAEFEQEKCSSPTEQPSLEGVLSEDAELDNIILLETLEVGDVDYGSRVNHINHNIRVTSLTSDLGDSSNGQLSPLSTASE